MQRKEETAKERLSLGGEKQRQPERDMERDLGSQETEIQRREPEKYRQPETEGQRKGQRDTKGCRNSRVKDTEVTPSKPCLPAQSTAAARPRPSCFPVTGGGHPVYSACCLLVAGLALDFASSTREDFGFWGPLP